MKLKTLKKSHLQNLEHSQFAIHVYEISKEADIKKLNLLLPALKAAIDAEEEVLNLPREKEYTKELKILDKARDESYRAFCLCVASGKYRHSEAVRKAAEEVGKVLKRYPRVPSSSNDYETGSIRNLVVDLRDEKFEPLITLLGAKLDLDQLSADNDAFSQLFLKHFSAKAPIPTAQVRRSRAMTDKAINAIVLRITSLSDLEPDTVGLSSLIIRYNKLVSNRKLTLILRKAARKRRSGDDIIPFESKKSKSGKGEQEFVIAETVDEDSIGEEKMEKTAESSGGGEDVPVETKSDGGGEEEKPKERSRRKKNDRKRNKEPSAVAKEKLL